MFNPRSFTWTSSSPRNFKYRHAKELERVATQRRDDLIRAHGPLIEQARREEGEALRSEYETKVGALLDVTERMLLYGRRSMHLAAIRGIDTHRVPIDAISNATRTLRELAETVPPAPWIEGDEAD